MNETSAKKRSVRKKPEVKRKRDSALTKESILQAATFEFCRNGLGGARVDAIAARAKANMRLLYHYFGDKNGLYLAALEHVYTEIRAAEQQLNLDSLDPATALQELIDFTFAFFQNHQDYIAMINTENLQRGKYLRKSRKIATLTMPLVSNIENILRRGAAAGIFRGGIDPIQLYVTITAFSYFHVSNRHTLSLMFDKDLSDPQWLADRRMHTHDVIATWLMAPDALRKGGKKVSSPKLSPVRGKASDLV
ncbi:MAG: TetR/AcrR family transcriptional regulator [Afipia sp.]|nr:TetR/AcrR family transcriptional regulator [Afipia sp.]